MSNPVGDTPLTFASPAIHAYFARHVLEFAKKLQERPHRLLKQLREIHDTTQTWSEEKLQEPRRALQDDDYAMYFWLFTFESVALTDFPFYKEAMDALGELQDTFQSALDELRDRTRAPDVRMSAAIKIIVEASLPDKIQMLGQRAEAEPHLAARIIAGAEATLLASRLADVKDEVLPLLRRGEEVQGYLSWQQQWDVLEEELASLGWAQPADRGQATAILEAFRASARQERMELSQPWGRKRKKWGRGMKKQSGQTDRGQIYVFEHDFRSHVATIKARGQRMPAVDLPDEEKKKEPVWWHCETCNYLRLDSARTRFRKCPCGTQFERLSAPPRLVNQCVECGICWHESRDGECDGLPPNKHAPAKVTPIPTKTVLRRLSARSAT